MRYRLLGNSGLRVSEAALGTMTFGEDWGWGTAKDEARRVYDVFREAGGNFIDTANVELVDFIAAGTTPESLIAFRPSDAAQQRVNALISKKQDGTLSAEEESELDDFLHLEHILILAKAQARRHIDVAQ
jgi:hypothetical protein